MIICKINAIFLRYIFNMMNSSDENILLSVVTPVYNGERFVQQAYDCLCRQTHKNWEWVVVDDGSTDRTPALLHTLEEQDSRIRFFQQPNSGSAKHPRDHAVYDSKGEYIIPLDIDDLLCDDYLELMLDRQQETDADIVYPQMHIVDLATGRTTMTLPKKGFDTTKVYAARDLVRETAPEWNIGCNGGIYRRHAWINMSWPEKKEPVWMNSDEVDERLYLIHARKAAFSQAVYYYQNHEQSITTHLSPKMFHTQKTSLQLLDIMEHEFGRDSEEYRRMNRRAFCDWRWKMSLYVKHHDQLVNADAEIHQNLAACFRRLDIGVLTLAERIQFMNLVSFPLVLALMCLKYNPRLLVEKMMQRFNPEAYANKYTRRREEQEARTMMAASYQEEQALKHFEPHTVSMFCGNAPSGGLIDRLRGAVSTFQACQQAERSFKLHFTHPFVLTDYLVPNEYDWTIRPEEVTFSPSQSLRLIVSSVYDSPNERRHQQEQIQTAVSSNRQRQLHVYTNAAFCYDNDFASTFQLLFKPSARLQQHIDETTKSIGAPYVTVSARFCNCLDDFNEEVYSEPLSASERRQLLDGCMAELRRIVEKNPGKKLVVCSDSTTFINEAGKQFDIITTPGTISHIGNDGVHNYDYYEKTFLDFYVIVGASKAYLLKGPHMMKSGFPYAASLVSRKPLNTIEF